MTTPTSKRIVCLANSRKWAGRCVAGKEISAAGTPGDWIRPVGDRENEAVSDQERCYPDGRDPQVLDIIEVPLAHSKPKSYQQENWLLDDSRPWRQAGNIAWDDLPQLADADGPFWTNGFSSRGGQNDQVPEEIAPSHGTSLRLVKVHDLTVIVSEPARPSANFPILRGRFSHGGETYCFRITDPVSPNPPKGYGDGGQMRDEVSGHGLAKT